MIDQPPLLPAAFGYRGKLLLLMGVGPERPAVVSLCGGAGFNYHSRLVFKLCGQADASTAATDNGYIQLSGRR